MNKETQALIQAAMDKAQEKLASALQEAERFVLRIQTYLKNLI